jgi:hypothetical protein
MPLPKPPAMMGVWEGGAVADLAELLLRSGRANLGVDRTGITSR